MKVLLKIQNLPAAADRSPGWTGRRLWLALDRMSCEIEPLSAEYCVTWLGGRGFNAQVLEEHLKGNKISQSSSNVPLCFAASPLAGTLAPFLGTVAISGCSGTSFNYSDAVDNQNQWLKIGDGFAAAMKYAGFDQVIITGRAAAPVYILIGPDFIELRDAGHLRGLGTGETKARIRYQELDPGIRILATGPVAEDQDGPAAILNSYNAIDNGNPLGSDLGSKNLKAIAFRGSGRLPLADPEGFSRECWKIFDQIHSYSLKKKKDTGYPLFQSENSNNNPESPGFNITRKAISCWACPAACGTILTAPAQEDYPYYCLKSDIDYLKQAYSWAEDYQFSDLIKTVYLLNDLGYSLPGLTEVPGSMAENVMTEIINFRKADKNNQPDRSGILTLHQRIKNLLSLARNNSARKFQPGKGKNEKTLKKKKLFCQINLLGGCDQAARFLQEEEDVWAGLYKGLFTSATGIRLQRDDLNRSVTKVLQLEKQLFQTNK